MYKGSIRGRRKWKSRFHVEATNQAEQIRQLGWGAWEPNPRNYPVALASALYAVTYSEPWVVVPINGILFGIAVVAVRGLLTVLFDSAVVALLALAPFFMFPSFVPIWGQLHKDINTGAGFSVVLCALVLAAKPGPRSLGWLGCAVMAALGMGLMGSSRFYAMAIVAVGTVAFVTLAFLGRNCARGRLLVVAAVVLLAALASIGASTLIRGTVEELTPPPGTRQAAVSTDPASAPSPPAPSPPVPSPPAAPPVETPSVDVSGPSWSWSSLRLPQTRHSDASLSRWDNCLPDPTRDILDRLLFNLCYTREGYVLDALKVGVRILSVGIVRASDDSCNNAATRCRIPGSLSGPADGCDAPGAGCWPGRESVVCIASVPFLSGRGHRSCLHLDLDVGSRHADAVARDGSLRRRTEDLACLDVERGAVQGTGHFVARDLSLC